MLEAKNRNLFEIDNARDLNRKELVDTFVETSDFKRLLSPKNHIVLGERGSGKTALAKMLSHDHLSLLQTDFAQQIIQDKSYIGMYVSIKTEWVSGLNNKPWQDENEKEGFFQWRLNIATCQALLKTVRSCLDIYIHNIPERVYAERQLLELISKSWSEEKFVSTNVVELQNYLEDIDYKRQVQFARKRATGKLSEEYVGLTFDTELFEPLRRAIILTKRVLKLPDETRWLLCLDEAEALDEVHHRILNTHLRTDSGNIVFKITTTPYSHYTQETNSGAPLVHGDDYEYVYIDQKFNLQENGFLVNKLFEKRFESSSLKYNEISLEKLLGHSKLLEYKDSYWNESSNEMALLNKYATKSTVLRANKILKDPKNSKEFSNQISRKLHGALLLKEVVKQQKGHKKLDIYSGVEMIMRCGDSNPRRLVRIFNRLLLGLSAEDDFSSSPVLPRIKQTDILVEFSANTLERTKSLPKCGPQLFETLSSIGRYMYNALHNMPLSTDLILAVEIDKYISDKDWLIIERAVEWGYLFPIRNSNNPDLLPKKEGKFHLAYVLAPYFRLLPRKGSARKLSTMLRRYKTPTLFIDDFLLFDLCEAED